MKYPISIVLAILAMTACGQAVSATAAVTDPTAAAEALKHRNKPKSKAFADRFFPTYPSVCDARNSVARPVPDFLRTAVMYQLFTRMFTPEGTFAAAMRKLPELKDLGIDVIYLTPHQLADDDPDPRYWSARQKKCGFGNPKNPYRQKDFFAVDPEYGTAADLKAFVDEAHRLGMRVLFDLVYFHCGPTAAFLKDHPDFIVRNPDGSPRLGDWAFPEMDISKRSVRDYLHGNMVYLLETFGADGFRCDVADMLPVDFWEEGYRRCKAVRPDVIMMCEGLKGDDQMAAFDLSYGFYTQWTLVEFLRGKQPASMLETAWRAQQRDFPRNFHWMRCFENHDFANLDPGEKRKEELYGHALNAAMIATCFLLDGVPMLYNGQEIADASPHSIWSNRDHGGWHIDWTRGDDAAARERRALVKRLTRLRHDNPALFDAPVVWNNVDDPDAYSFTRPLPGGGSLTLDVNLREKTFAIRDAVSAVDLREKEAAKLPSFEAESSRGGVVDVPGSHGRGAYRFKITQPWRGGLNRWPSVTLPAAAGDWTGYDRLVVDVMSVGDGGDILRGFVSDAKDHVGRGMPMPAMPLGTDEWRRWVIPLDWTKGVRAKTADPVDVKRISRVHFFFETPFVADVELSGFRLLKPGEPLPEPDREFVAKKAAPARERARQRREAVLAASRDAFISRCRAVGQDGGVCWVGKATSMERVRPLSTFEATAADRFGLRLARGETEALQVVVMPARGCSLTNVSVKVGALKSAAGDVLAAEAFSAYPVGYVETKHPGPYRAGHNVATNLPGGYFRTTRPVETGWFPEPVMSYLDSVDVGSGVVQSFWVSCRAPRNQRKGVYGGELEVRGEGFVKSFPLEVRVYGFEVPVKSPLPLAVSFRPEVMPPNAAGRDAALSERILSDPDSPVNAWQRHRREWADFLTDHYFSPDWLYGSRAGWWEELVRLEKEGRLGNFNLDCWCPVLGKAEPTDEAIAANVAANLARLRPQYLKAKELGLLGHAYIYGCDECPAYFRRRVNPVIAAFRREFPGLKLLTTTYDETFGTATNSCDFDAYCPTTDRYAACLDGIPAGRRIGKEVWWYIACNQRAPLANPFIEDQLIGCRQLMGAQAVKFRPDGFLYYQISIWNSLRPISGRSAFTDWNPLSFGTIHGDGNLLCCGPDGTPLTTVRFENFRDGLEDYAYAKEFERVTGRVCEVPPDVCRGIDQFTDDPAAYYRWRDALAEAIEAGGR